MKLFRGIQKDSKPANVPEGSWISARNKVMSRKLDALLSEKGFAVFGDYPTHLVPNGKIELASGDTVIFSVASDIMESVSEIGILFYDGKYETRISDPLLGFDRTAPITGTYQYTFNNRLTVMFRDDINVPRILNLDKPPFELDANYALVDKDKITLANLFPGMSIPEIRLAAVSDGGGVLLSGVYYPAVAYEIEAGDATNYVTIGNPISIYSDLSTIPYDEIAGNPAGTITSKAISLVIHNVDRRFKNIKLAMISRIDGVVSAVEVGTYAINGPSLDIQFTGGEATFPILNDEILVKRVNYTNFKTVTNLEGTLIAGNVKAAPRIDFQWVANNIKVDWYAEDLISHSGFTMSFKDPVTIYSKRCFMPEEVYAVYVRPIMTDGSDVGAFHVPGREVTQVYIPETAETIYENALLVKTGGDNPLELNVDQPTMGFMRSDYDISPGKVKYFHVQETAKPDGGLAYWENENEFYPDTLDANGNRFFPEGKVRHHKMPSLSFLDKQGRPFAKKAGLTINGRPLGVKLSNIILPPELEGKVAGVEVLYARRTTDNATVYGYSQLFGFQWEENDTPFGTQPNPHLKFRTHAFEMMLDKPAVVPTHFSAQIKLTQTQKTINGAANYNTALRETDDYTAITSPFNVRVKDTQYIPAHVNQQGKFDNTYREEAFVGKLNVPPTTLDNNKYKNLLVAIKGFKTTIYNKFTEQQLISTGKVIMLDQIAGDSDEPIAYGGDTFFTPYSYRLHHREGFGEAASDSDAFNSMQYQYYVVPSVHNIGLRHEGKQWWERVYPKSNWDLHTYHPQFDLNKFPTLNQDVFYDEVVTRTNYFGYNKDYTSVNELNTSFPFDGQEEESDKPFLIIRSNVTASEQRSTSWRVFLPNAYYESVKNRGEIVNLEAYGSTLLIHHRHDLLRTVEKLSIDTTAGAATLGSGDIFRMAPEPIVKSKTGYAGTQHQLACLLTKVGYMFVDVDKGKVFILSDSLKEISNNGLYEWMKEFLPLERDEDNAYNGNGFLIAYDDTNNRMLLTKKETALPVGEYKGIYREDQEWLSSLNIGDIIFKDNKYQRVITPIIL